MQPKSTYTHWTLSLDTLLVLSATNGVIIFKWISHLCLKLWHNQYVSTHMYRRRKTKMRRLFTHRRDDGFKKQIHKLTLPRSAKLNSHSHAHRAPGTMWLISQLLPTFNLLLRDSGPVSLCEFVCVCVYEVKRQRNVGCSERFSHNLGAMFVWQEPPYPPHLASY